jgi:hypothetical protein
MLLIRPKSVDSNMLLSSSIPASEANWDSATIYATGDLVTVPTGLDLNFVTGAYVAGSSSYGSLASIPGFSYSRSGTIAVFNAGGGIDTFAANTAPINSYGLHSYSSVTNGLARSQEFDNASWTKNNATITANATTAPDGTSTADKVTGTGAAATYVRQDVANSGTYNFSIFAKAGTQSTINIGDVNVGSLAHFDLSAGTVVKDNAATALITSVGSGWYRCDVTHANTAGFARVTFGPGTYIGATTTNDFYVWQGQTIDNVAFFSDGGPMVPTVAASGSTGTPTLSVNCPNGTYTATYTFDDSSTQAITTVISGGVYTVPAFPTLNRPRVSRVVLQAPTGAAGHRVYQSLSGGASATITMTIASPCVVTWNVHGLAANTPILFATSGALPTGLTAGTIYYVLAPLTNSFNVSATAGGAAINTTGTQSGVHTVIANPNKGYDPSSALSAPFWLDIGPTNKWAMFDDYNGTTTTDPTLIDVTVAVTGRVDSVALLNIVNAASARVIVSTTLDGTIFDQTYSLTSADGIADWYDYFFEEVVLKRKLLVTPLPVNANPTVRVILTGTGTGLVQCGTLIVGLSKDLGETDRDGAQVGITDYSRKEVDTFGNYTIVPRAFSDRGSFKIRMAKASVDGVRDLLSDFRTTPAVYAASLDYNSTLIWGFFRDFNIEIDYPLESLCSIEIEGLT